MNAKKIIYWISTLLICAMMAAVGVAYLMHVPKMDAAFASLGYPLYFQNMLGVAKLLGVIALLAPGFPLLKEWAYAGFTFTFIAAFISHLVAHQNQEAVGPVIALLLLIASYCLRPASRRLPFATCAPETYSPNKAADAQSTGA
jgi:uncharacterized membrane protein YphA (DoxX/SURF4 family)